MTHPFYDPESSPEAVVEAARQEGCLALGGPVLHPVLGIAIARCLGWSPLAVCDVAAGRAYVDDGRVRPLADDDEWPGDEAVGIGAIESMLARCEASPEGIDPKEWLVHTAPAPPDPGNEHWLALQPVAETITRYREMGAPDVILRNYLRDLQARFDALMEHWAEGEPSTGWRPSSAERRTVPLSNALPWASWEQRPPTDRVSSALWLDGERLLLTRGEEGFVLDLERGRATMRFAHGGLLARTCDETGRFAVLTKPHEHDGTLTDGSPAALAIFDVANGRWLSEVPAGLPAIVGASAEPEHAWLYDHCTDRSIVSPVARDRTHVFAYGRAYRTCWLGDGPEDGELWCLERGECLLELGPFLRQLPADAIAFDEHGRDVAVDADEPQPWLDSTGETELPGTCALSRTAEGTYAFATPRWCTFGSDAPLVPAFDVHASAFDPFGSRVALVGAHTIVVVERGGRRSALPLPLASVGS